MLMSFWFCLCHIDSKVDGGSGTAVPKHAITHRQVMDRSTNYILPASDTTPQSTDRLDGALQRLESDEKNKIKK